MIQEFGELGAAGVLTIYLDDEAPIARFGTRWLCQQKFTMGIFKSAKTTQAGVPHFCSNDVTVATALLNSWAGSATQLTQLGQFTTAPAVPIGTLNLVHDSVPLESVRSTGFYVFFLLLAIWSGALVTFALFFIGKIIKFFMKEGVHGYALTLMVVATLEGLLACGLRVIRHLVSPLQSSPRLAAFPDGVLARFLTQLPNLPSALSTLLISLEFFRVIAVGPLPPRQMVIYFCSLMAALAAVFAIGVWQISDSCTLLSRQLTDLAQLVQTGAATPADFTRVAAENESSVSDVVWAINGILLSALGLFFLAGVYSIVKVLQAAQSGSAAVRKSAGGVWSSLSPSSSFSRSQSSST